MFKVLLDAFTDSLKVVPVLLLAYLLIEYFHHKKGGLNIFSGNKYKQAVFGALLGAVPQCGFSVISSDLYSKKQISLGALFAVFIATSDEAVILLFGNFQNIFIIIALLAIKIIYALIIGILINLIFNKKPAKAAASCSCGHNHEHEHEQGEDEGNCHCCSDNIYKSAITHTLSIFMFLLIINVALSLFLYFIGFDKIAAVFENNAFSVFFASLIGLIPNCAASVLLIEMFSKSLISFAALMAGLTSAAGLGLLYLFKQNKNLKENLLITLGLFCFAIALGVMLSFFSFEKLLIN